MRHRLFYKWHIWLGWLVGVPIILWTATGLFMVARPIEEVRGNHLRSEAVENTMTREKIALFADTGSAISGAQLISQSGSMVWLVTYEDGATVRFDATTGQPMPRIDKIAAAAVADTVYAPDEKIETTRYFAASDAPFDLRREVPSWQVHFADGTNIYIDALTGETLAVRTRFWRAFDFMWGLHIMDLQTREDTHHPILIIFAIVSLAGSILGFVMLFTRRGNKITRKKRKPV